MAKDAPPEVQQRTAILLAVERLCAKHNPASVSMRHVAAEAGVSPGLIYYYFDSRDDLMAATLRHITLAADAEAAEFETLEDIVGTVLAFLTERPSFARIVAAMTLDNIDVTEAMGGHPVIRRLVASVDVYPNGPTQVGAIIALLLGAGAFGAGINRALNRDESDPRLFDQLAEVLVRMAQ